MCDAPGKAVASIGAAAHPPAEEPRDKDQMLACEYALLAVIHDKCLDIPGCDRLTDNNQDDWVELLWEDVCEQGTTQEDIGMLPYRLQYIEAALSDVKSELAQRVRERGEKTQIVEKPAETVHDDEGSKNTDNGLTKAERLAYQSYEYAVSKKSGLADSTDNNVYKWLKENGNSEADYELPCCNTWKRQVRAGRKYHGTQKNSPRAGRLGRSTITSSQIDSLYEVSSQYNNEAD